jgi:kynurenine formamidase
MLQSGEGVDPESESRAGSQDVFIIAPHGLQITHIDAPCHTIFKGTLFNGISASAVTTSQGALAGNIELVSEGIVGRGVLLDIPGSKGRDWLEDGEAIYPQDLEECEAWAGTRVEGGDILMVRTGYRKRNPRGAAYVGEHYPGLQAACLPWLHEREISLLATDVAADVQPHGYDSLGVPVHTVGMWAMGLWLIDNCNLETVSEVCISERRWTFECAIAPLILTRGTGSPVNPLAIF